eukprot:TRINITY_DN33237_c0_g1_i1.p1 TRINITY_DN33237_c0_g1~~TRINITY_DN33237_c0_g1_i1.p1  ORF type:complete len:240 (+),score=46.26 TRINITY_DN33237_c0_g1_i1:80-799(+)
MVVCQAEPADIFGRGPSRPSKQPGMKSSKSGSQPSRSHRPQSAPHHSRLHQQQQQQVMRSSSRKCAEEMCNAMLKSMAAAKVSESSEKAAPRQRARPTSPKASKHKRVMDETDDELLIYEDLETDTEEMYKNFEVSSALGIAEKAAALRAGECGARASSQSKAASRRQRPLSALRGGRAALGKPPRARPSSTKMSGLSLEQAASMSVAELMAQLPNTQANEQFPEVPENAFAGDHTARP